MASGWVFAADLLIICVFWVVGFGVCFDYVNGVVCVLVGFATWF